MNVQELRDHAMSDFLRQMAEVDQIYTKVGVYLASVPVLGAIAYGILETRGKPMSALDIAMGVIADAGTIGGMVALAVAAFLLILCMRPHQYETIPTSSDLLKYASDYRAVLESNQYPTEYREQAVEAALTQLVTEQAAHCARSIQRVNQARQNQLKRANGAVFIGTTCILIAGLSWMVIKIV